jgi:hypothetical protein
MRAFTSAPVVSFHKVELNTALCCQNFMTYSITVLTNLGEDIECFFYILILLSIEFIQYKDIFS